MPNRLKFADHDMICLKAALSVVFLFSFAVQPVLGEVTGDAKAAALRAEVARRVAEYEKNPNLICGIRVTDLRTGKPLIDINARKPYITASNMKLLTAAFALEKLRADFNFTTSVYLLGKDIVIVGDGDPTLGCADLSARAGVSVYSEFDRWARAIKKKAGNAFTGDLLLCSRFKIKDFHTLDTPERQHHLWYRAPVGGLNFHDNNYNVEFTLAEKKVTSHVAPSSRFIKIVNELVPGQKDDWKLTSSEDESVVTLRGTIARSTRRPKIRSANHPAMLLGRVLTDRIVRAGVPFKGRIRAVRYDFDVSKAKLICSKTTSLTESLKRMNKRSLNMAALCHYLRAGDGTWAGTQKLMTAAIIKHYGLDANEFTIREGSGLSGANRVSPRQFVDLLTKVLKRTDGKLIVGSLPISGVDGTLQEQNRFQDPPYRGRVLGKTGTIGEASCLTGFVLDKNKRPALVFSMMMNRLEWSEQKFIGPAREVKDSIVRMLVDYIDGK